MLQIGLLLSSVSNRPVFVCYDINSKYDTIQTADDPGRLR